MSKTDNMKEIDLGMSNFDHEIDEGFAEALKALPGKVFGRHAGWEFNGRCWFADGKFHEEVWRYGSLRALVSADTLPELMSAVNADWGSE
jgi:hypothetical protein